jgi:hypothetical protein
MPRKKSEHIELPSDKPAAARRLSRAKLGPTPPSRTIPPATRKPPKHKKNPLNEPLE